MIVKSFRNGWMRIRDCLCDPWAQKILRLLTIVGLLLLCLKALADGDDLLQGTDASAWATLTGTGKKYIYLIEFVMAIASYIATRKLMVFTGFIVISTALDIVLHFAGEST